MRLDPNVTQMHFKSVAFGLFFEGGSDAINSNSYCQGVAGYAKAY